MFELFSGLALAAGEGNWYDSITTSFASLSTDAQAIAGLVVPIICGVAAVPIGVKILKRLINKV